VLTGFAYLLILTAIYAKVMRDNPSYRECFGSLLSSSKKGLVTSLFLSVKKLTAFKNDDLAEFDSCWSENLIIFLNQYVLESKLVSRLSTATYLHT